MLTISGMVESKKSTTKIFRDLIYALISDNHLANNNESSLMEKFPDKINAVRGIFTIFCQY